MGIVCHTCPGLIPIIQALPGHPRGVEIGVWAGRNMHEILSLCPNIWWLYGIDPYVAYTDWNGQYHDQYTMDQIYRQALVALQSHRYRSFLYNVRSEVACRKFEDGELDFILVDGLHTSEAILCDLGWCQKVRPGGLCAFHDASLIGQHVLDFLTLRGWGPLNSCDNDICYFFKPNDL